MALEYLIPKFAHETWRVVNPNARGEVQTFDALTDFDARERSLDVLSDEQYALQIEAKPTIWAQAETFRMRLDEIMRRGAGPDQEDFQVWGGLLAALFQGDLQVLRQSGTDIDAMDEDLRPALMSSVPFDPDGSRWPDGLADLHRHGNVVLLVAGAEQVVLGGGYAPSLIFPARRQPRIGESSALSVFDDERSLYPNLHLDWLMERYAQQDGFAASFGQTIRELEMRIAGGGNERLKEALALLRETVLERWAEDAAGEGALRDCVESAEGVLPFRFRGPGPEQSWEGGAGVWDRYRLRTTGPDGHTVLLIPENVDPKLNPWVNELAFSGGLDVHSRYKDLEIRRDAGGQVLSVVGRNGAVYEVPGNYHVLSLDPQAPPERRMILDAVMYYDGEDRALRNELLDPVHGELRRRLTSREDVTLLVPLHVEALRHFPQLAQEPARYLELTDGSIGERRSESVGCRLTLPLAGGDHLELSWQANLMAWKHSETRLPQVDVWPALRSHPRSPVQWSAYFLRTRHEGESLAAYFHGERALRDRLKEGYAGEEKSLHSFDFLNEPPRLAEVFHKENPAVTLGLVFLDRGVYQETELAAPWDLAIDFGSTNTSAAFRAGKENRPELLHYSAWSRPILDRQQSEIIEREPHPGWFPEDLSHLRLERIPETQPHSGFFSTMLAFKKWLAVDEERLRRLCDLSNLKREDLAELIGSVEMPGLKPNLAMLLLDDETYSEWEVADGLKWSTGTEDMEQRRKAYRAIFLEMLLLHAIVECFAQTGDFPARYHFTYPLSMPRDEVSEFKAAMKHAPRAVEMLADSSRAKENPEVSTISESHAAFRAFLDVEQHDRLAGRAVMIDMGGGSADYAVFAGGRQDPVAFLDSLHLAGDRFFQFLRDVSEKKEHELLAKSVAALLGERLEVPPIGDLKKDRELREFRRKYNVRICAEMPGKGGGQFEQDPELVRARMDRAALEIRREIDAFSAAHWMRALFKAVITHGLLLGVAPIDGRPVQPTHLDLVLLGNGWGLLHHAGVPREDLEELVRECYRMLITFLERQESAAKADEASVFPGPDAVSVRFMDEKIRESFGTEVFSKDVISVGAILAEGEADGSRPLGILGHEVRVRAVTGVGTSDAAQEPIRLPWHLPVEKRQVDAFVNQVVEERTDGGDAPADDPYPLTNGRVIALEPEPLQPGDHGEYCLLEQLLVLDLLRTGGYGGHPRNLLETRDWSYWNQAVNDSIHQLVQFYGERARGEKERFTSLITDLWEYPLTKEVVRRQLFERMRED